MSEHLSAGAGRYVSAKPPLQVVVNGPRGSFAGWCTGWNGDRVHVRWTEGPGLSYMRVLPAQRVQRAG